jgi:hypothetical protein
MSAPEVVPAEAKLDQVNFFDDIIEGGLRLYHQYEGPQYEGAYGNARGPVYIPGALQSREYALRAIPWNKWSEPKLREDSITARIARLGLLTAHVEQPPTFYVHEAVADPTRIGLEPSVLAGALGYMCRLAAVRTGEVQLRCVNDRVLTEANDPDIDSYVLGQTAKRGGRFVWLGDLDQAGMPGNPGFEEAWRLDGAFGQSPHVLSHEESVEFFRDTADTLRRQ